MSDNSKIEWTEATWSPTLGCTIVSEGCHHCYAMRTVHRMAFNPNEKVSTAAEGLTAYRPGVGPVWTNEVRSLSERLGLPLRWKRPRRIFVNSQSDLFHERVSDEFIARVFIVMALAQRHTFQVFTKRHGRMRSLLRNHDRWNLQLADALEWVAEHVDAPMPPADFDRVYAWLCAREYRTDSLPPLLNVWLGVSVENQHWADIRIPALLETPAVVRWISAEPLLGPVDLRFIDYVDTGCGGCSGLPSPEHEPPCGTEPGRHAGINWLVCGGESGPRARPMNPAWARSLRNQCQAAGVPFHFKQYGDWLGYEADSQAPFWIAPNGSCVDGHLFPASLGDGEPVDGWWAPELNGVVYQRTGKKGAGRELDGRRWDEYPDQVVAGAS